MCLYFQGDLTCELFITPNARARMKVFVIYDAPDAPPSLHHKLAITLPAKWLDQSVEKVLVAFLGAYNKKFPDSVLVASELVLSVKEPSPFARR